MTHHERIDYEVQKTLECLNRMPKLEGNPFFHTRVMARLQSAETTHRHDAPWRVKVVFTAALLFALLAANIFTLANNWVRSAESTPNRSEAVTSMMREYYMSPDTPDLILTTEIK